MKQTNIKKESCSGNRQKLPTTPQRRFNTFTKTPSQSPESSIKSLLEIGRCRNEWWRRSGNGSINGGVGDDVMEMTRLWRRQEDAEMMWRWWERDGEHWAWPLSGVGTRGRGLLSPRRDWARPGWRDGGEIMERGWRRRVGGGIRVRVWGLGLGYWD